MTLDSDFADPIVSLLRANEGCPTFGSCASQNLTTQHGESRWPTAKVKHYHPRQGRVRHLSGGRLRPVLTIESVFAGSTDSTSHGDGSLKIVQMDDQVSFAPSTEIPSSAMPRPGLRTSADTKSGPACLFWVG